MIYSIQYLRLIACLMVVILHISLKNHLSNGNDFLYFGASGVDIFFIISGYIMCHINSKKPTTPIKFIKDRILRIYPFYLLALIPFLIIFLVRPDLVNTHGQVPSILKSITLFPYLHGGNLNLVAWTLSFELFFYLLFSLGMVFGKCSTLVTAILILISLGLGNYYDIYFIKDPISLEFLLGMIIFHVFNLSKFSGKILLNNYMVLAAVIFILFSFYLLILTPANGIDGNGFDRVFFYGGPAFLIFVSFRLIESYLPKSKFLLFLGDASYSIYLTHILVINAVYQLFKFFGFQFDFSILMISLATGFSFIFGCLIHKFIEIPFIKLMRASRIFKN